MLIIFSDFTYLVKCAGEEKKGRREGLFTLLKPSSRPLKSLSSSPIFFLLSSEEREKGKSHSSTSCYLPYYLYSLSSPPPPPSCMLLLKLTHKFSTLLS